ncbi:MAG: DUF4835 family protein [Candidatus Kapabacteria bacterium]|nr:DUF4835 family protein [Candidatus Kapabacteria bacterium]
MRYYIFLIIILTCLKLKSQEIDATVQVSMDQVQVESRKNAETLASDLKTYINSQKYTNNDWDGPKIPVDVSIYLSGGPDRYYAKMFIVSKRTLKGQDAGASAAFRIIENNWTFAYSRNANLVFNLMRYNEVTTLIDFYLAIIIGLDMDTYGDLEGTQMFGLARQIFQVANSASAVGFEVNSLPGATTKFSLITDLTDMHFEPMRKLIYSYYNDGLQILSKDKAQGLENLYAFLLDLADYKSAKMTGPSYFLQIFFDTKAQELATLFNKYPNPDVFKQLRYLDPTNSTIYNDSEKGKMEGH